MADLLRLDIDGGKYTLIQEESGKTLLHRYGEPWLEDLHGAKVFLAMGYELEELRAENARLRGRIADMKHLLTGARNLLSRLPSDVFGHAYEDHVYIPRSSIPPRSWDIEAKPVSVRDHFLAEVHKALRQPKEQDDEQCNIF